MPKKNVRCSLSPAFGAVWVTLLALVLVSLSPLHAGELSCEQGDNAEGGCCCFQKAHTYRFEPVPVSRLEVTFDTGRGLGCKSTVTIQLLLREGWQTLRTVSAVSSSGRSQQNRLSGSFVLGDTIAGVRIDDGGRCYIDYSKIVVEEAGGQATGDPPPGPRPPGPEPSKLASGTYHLEAQSGRLHKSVWRLENEGGKITGTSEWDCCPGRRTDPLEGSVRGGEVQIARSCTGQGMSGRCLQVYEGKISENGIASGNWSHNGRVAGKWRLEPASTRPPTQPPSRVTRIVAEPAPPYRETPVTIDFAQEPGPVTDAVWWLDGRRMTNADVFFWTFGESGNHEIELRDAAGQQLARHQVRVMPSGPARVEIVPDRSPPFDTASAVKFRQEPRPVTGARWYVDGRYASGAASFSRQFQERRIYQVALRGRDGEVLATYEVQVEDQADRLWGRRRRSPGFDGVRNDLRELELKRSAAVTDVEGSAAGYCVWTVDEGGAFDHRVVCGKDDEPITGAILLPGRYVVVPALADDQRASEVTIYLRPR